MPAHRTYRTRVGAAIRDGTTGAAGLAWAGAPSGWPGAHQPSGWPGLVIGGPGPLGVTVGERLGAIGVTGLDGLDQLGVLGPRAVAAGRRHHPVVPLHPAADDVGQLGQHRAAADGRDLGA